MVLPVYLAMTPSEMLAAAEIPEKCAWMACQFSPYSEGLTAIPDTLPSHAMLILSDCLPCGGHSPSLVCAQLHDAAQQLGCESVLLDFQREPEPESQAMARAVAAAMPCPVAVSEKYAHELSGPVFLSPAPLHTELRDYLAPWNGREIWLEAALCQEEAAVTPHGTLFAPRFPPELLSGGFYDDTLCCHYRTFVTPSEIRFTLFDTAQSLGEKLTLAASLGVTRAVGLYQQLGEAAH